jgi:hypothetical protein
MSNIVSKEIMNNAYIFDDDDLSKDSRSTTSSIENMMMKPRLGRQSPTNTGDDQFTWSRVRTVSIDSPLSQALPKHPEAISMSLGIPAIVTPMSTPIARGRPVRKASQRLSQKARRDHLHLKLPKMPQLQPTTDVKEHKKKALQTSVAKGLPIKKILRKKFSWKNYPGKKEPCFSLLTYADARH